MTYEKIKEELEDIINTNYRRVKDRVIDDTIDRIAELDEFADNLNDTDEDDTDYQEIKELVEDANRILNDELDERENDYDDEEY